MFRTPIGFHDAYVAAPSRKAALEAWGAESNLFAQGIAEQVTDPELMTAPLERPGEVIKVLRGSAKEQLAAAGRQAKRGPSTGSAGPPPLQKQGRKEKAPKTAAGKPQPRPSRAAVDKAERALKEAEQAQREALTALREEEKALEKRRRKLEEKQERELGRLRTAADEAGEKYRQSMADWARRS